MYYSSWHVTVNPFAEKGEPEEEVNEKGEVEARLKKCRPKLPKPECVKLLEEVTDKNYFAGW
jgi:hypothetical protein